MATYRALAIIPTAADMPDSSGVAEAAHEDIVRALNAVVQFPAAMATHSAGMCEIDLSVRVYDDVLPSSVFATRNGQEYIQPNRAAIETGDRGYYDAHLLFNPASLTTATTFRGLGGATSGVPYCWVKIGSDELPILVHEWGHAMTVYMETVMATYTNFPTCDPEPAMHCAVDYGYENDMSAPWFDGFFQGTLSDGTGINATGWATATPTEAEVVTAPYPYRPSATRWGRLGVLR